MKKAKIYTVLVSLTVLFGVGASKVNASSVMISNNNNTYLGRTINIVTSSNYNEIAPSCVLDNEYYSSLTYFKNDKVGPSKDETYIESSSSNVRNEYNSNFSYSAQANNIRYYGFTFGARERCDFNLKYNESYYASRSYMSIVNEKDYENYYISNVYAKTDEFSENLSIEFEMELEKLANGTMSYERFFETNGTHLIANYTTGDRLYIDYCVVTNEKVISKEIASSLSTDISAKFADESCQIDYNLATLNSYGLSEDYSELKYKISCASGKAFNTTNIAKISDDVDSWIDSVNNKNYMDENSVIVKFNANGLVPIWELLPIDSPVSKSTMISNFISYAKENGMEYPTTSSYNYSNFGKTVNLRSGEQKITDCDRFSNKIDYFSVNSIYGISLFKEKYDKIVFDISFEAKKKNKGNRYIYLYKKTDAYKQSELHNEYLNFSSVSCSSSYEKVNISLVVYANEIDNFDFAIVWRASGDGSDTWYNKNVVVTYKAILNN